eukprot:8287444-Lingulodinium_polyedra.AAC.1
METTHRSTPTPRGSTCPKHLHASGSCPWPAADRNLSDNSRLRNWKLYYPTAALVLVLVVLVLAVALV